MWQKWLRNGRVATIGMVVVFTTWLCFQIWASTKPPALDTLLLGMGGVWVANLSIENTRAASRREDRDDELG